MSLALTAIFSYSVGVVLTALLMYTLFNLITSSKKGLHAFFESMAKNHPAEWSQHCPLCKEQLAEDALSSDLNDSYKIHLPLPELWERVVDEHDGTPGTDGFILWQFQSATRIFDFECRNPEGWLTSVKIGNVEQLIEGARLPLTSFPMGGALVLPAMKAGEFLEITVEGFAGEIRPVGVYIP